MIVTMAMTAAPAPASAHTNRWKVKSSWNAERLHVIIIIIFIISGCCSFIVMQNCSLLLAMFWPTSLDSHILKNFSDPVHTFLSSEIVTAPDKITNTKSSCSWESTTVVTVVHFNAFPGKGVCFLRFLPKTTNMTIRLNGSSLWWTGDLHVTLGKPLEFGDLPYHPLQGTWQPCGTLAGISTEFASLAVLPSGSAHIWSLFQHADHTVYFFTDCGVIAKLHLQVCFCRYDKHLHDVLLVLIWLCYCSNLVDHGQVFRLSRNHISVCGVWCLCFTRLRFDIIINSWIFWVPNQSLHL